MTDNEAVFDKVQALLAKSPEVLNQINDNGKVPFVVIPTNTKVESLQSLFPAQNIRQHVVLLESGSFVDYVNRFKTPDTMIFADVSEDGATFKAKLDYHASAENELVPGTNDHSAAFETIKTPEFKLWLANNGKQMSQLDFAAFLEDNQRIFEFPTGAALLELVQTLHGKQDVTFDKAFRLDNGASSVKYNEVIEVAGRSAATEGKMELPKEITVVFPVFQGSAPYRVRARLKVRVNGQKLVLWFETIDKHLIVRDAIMAIVADISRPTLAVEAKGGAKTSDFDEAEPLFRPGTGIVPLLGRV